MQYSIAKACPASFFIPLSHQELELIEILQSDACSLCHTVQRILGHMERNVNLVGQTFVETAQKGTASSQINTVAHDVGIELWRCVLEC